MPDWRDPSEYPKPEKTTANRWAWEFLRRNPLYRSDWDLYRKRCAEIRAKFPGLDMTKREETGYAYSMDDNDRLGTVYEPDIRASESAEQWLKRVRRGVRYPLEVWLSRKWGLRSGMPDPAGNSTAIFWERSASRVATVGDRYDGSKDRTHPAILFDLALPLEPQLKAAGRYLKAERAFRESTGELSSSRARRRPGLEYQRHLRLLDALDELGYAETRPRAQTLRQIGQKLFPGQHNPKPDRPIDQKIIAMIAVARALRDHDYRLLPTMPASPTRKK